MLNPFLRYPLYRRNLTYFERLVQRINLGVIKCLVCGSYARMHTIGVNLRETCLCARCNASNRQRQMAYMILHTLTSMDKKGVVSLHDLVDLPDLRVYNTEATGSIHEQLKTLPRYRCSQYYGEYASGTLVDGIMHQDLMALSFDSDSFDLVLSSDVFEHIADPYQAHREIHRVLRVGGRHVFTVPFFVTEIADDEATRSKELMYFFDDVRAEMDSAGMVKYHKSPIFHGDPVSLRPEGALVFTIFGLEMIVKLAEIGFRTNMFLLYKPRFGILGHDAIFFEAIKV